ncbi:ATP-binding cassette domain-containing protein [Dethiothermospora halolimnae]|uniref:ABC transporter ATP-binding protein n=1 Tax=Dethiothermospora halolimnae TaxID=3114390 RepID=UPI003CCB79E8
MLRLENVTKKYGKFIAVDNISLNINEGEIFGFVGPNGAGKTTTLKMISTLLKPTSGEIFINDIQVNENIKEVRDMIGYMPDFFGVYDSLRAEEYLDFYGDVAGLKKEERKVMIKDLLDLVELSHKRKAYVDNLSRGMKQRLCLARSLIHNPSLLILDEPASGMDPRARIQMKDILKELKKMGKTILISSHILSELSELCSHIGIIEDGKIVINGKVEDIMSEIYSGNNIKIKVLDNYDHTIQILKEYPKIGEVYNNDDYIEFTYDGDKEIRAKILKYLIENNIPVTSFTDTEGKLEEVFMKVTRGDKDD